MLKDSISKVQNETTEIWQASTIVKLEGHVLEEGNFDWYVVADLSVTDTLDFLKGATIIPSYTGYSKLWKKAFLLNPFEVDWLLFDIHDTGDIDYLFSILEVLGDQRDLWVSDKETRASELMSMIKKFIRSLARLLMFTTSLNYAI